MSELSVEHILLFAIIAFILYHLTNSCRGDSFSVDALCVNYNTKDWCDDMPGCWWTGQYCKPEPSTPACNVYTTKITCPTNQCEWNGLACESGSAVSCNPKLKPPQLCPGNISCPDCGSNVCPCPQKISLRPTNPSEFVERINKVYENPDSNGVFISMIYSIKNKKIEILNNLKNHENIYLDGSGSIMRKDIYPYLYGGPCDFGFIWDTDWLDKKLVDCFFPENAYTGDFGECIENDFDYCEFAGTSTPDRCSKGLNFYANQASGFIKDGKKNYGLPVPPNPTNCTTNKIYDVKLKEINQLDSKNCFSYTVDIFKEKGKAPLDYDGSQGVWSVSGFNEAVFLKDINEDGIEINKGLSMLKNLNKPLPVAILFVDSDEMRCNQGDAKITYNNLLKVLKSNFNGNTIVIKTTGRCGSREKCTFDNNYTTLDQMPGYDYV